MEIEPFLDGESRTWRGVYKSGQVELRDEEGRLHCDVGPALISAAKEGSEPLRLWYLHGEAFASEREWKVALNGGLAPAVTPGLRHRLGGLAQ